MRCPYCGCRSEGCGFCSAPGWDDDVRAMKEAEGMEAPSAEVNRTKEENDDAYYRLIIGVLGYDPRRRHID